VCISLQYQAEVLVNTAKCRSNYYVCFSGNHRHVDIVLTLYLRVRCSSLVFSSGIGCCVSVILIVCAVKGIMGRSTHERSA